MQRTFRAPGRVNLIGEHTDYSGGLVLPVALDRAVTLTAESATRITLVSQSHAETVDVAADGREAPASGWGRYVAAVAAELAALGRRPVGLRGVISSDLPEAAGLSSSAALEVVVAVALCAVADFRLPPLELAAAAQRAEYRAVGVPCGILDQAASLLGRAGCALLLDCATLEHRLVALPEQHALLVIDSGVPRRLEQSAYAERRAELERALAEAGGPAAARATPEAFAELESRLTPVAAIRLRHVVTENARVLAAEQALAGRDAAALRRLFADSHASLRDDFEVSTPQLDLLVESALEAGAVAARLTGGGFGGAIVALADADRADEIGAQVVREYAERSGLTAVVHLVRAGDGASEVRA